MARAKHPPVNLTDFKVKSLRPEADEYVQGDTQVPAFGVRVRPNGTLTYIVMKRLPGGTVPRRVTLGKIWELGLADARDKARQAIAEFRRGVNPNTNKRRARIAEASRREEAEKVRAKTGFEPDSFGALAAHYIAQECARLARGNEIEGVIRRYLLEPWGDRPVAELRRRDLIKLIDPIVERGRTQAAHKLNEVALRIINWAIDRGELEVNFLASPSRGRKRAGGLRRNKRDRVLSELEIRAIWAACESLAAPFGEMIRLLLLLGQRREEVAGMPWRELDLDRGLWVIGAARYKTRLEHAVPLPAIAVELIRQLPKVDDVYVFSTEPGTRYSGFSKSIDRLRRLSGIADWRIHDLRRTVRTGMSGLKNPAGHRVGADIAERVLGHVVGGVRGIYDRYEYLDEKREALELWAARIAEIVGPPPPSNVIPLRPGAAA